MSNEKLLGDHTAALLQKIGADKLARAYERVTGKPCNCANRRAALNRIHRAIIGTTPGVLTKHTQQVARPPVKQHNPPTQPVDEQPARK